MKITKYGHCCLLIETDNKKILTDPGGWSDIPENLTNIDFILITHEHGDHLHVDSLKLILENNPSATVITNNSVGEILKKEAIDFTIVADGDEYNAGGVPIEGHGTTHAYIYEGIPQVENTGYMIANRLYYPGDAFHNPARDVEILALPVAGPWMHIQEAVDFAKEVNPKVAFPVHDGMLKHMGPFHKIPEIKLGEVNILFKTLLKGETLNF